MPKLKPETEKIRAIDNTRKYIKSGLNQTRMAEMLGKAPSTINRNVNRLPVQSELQKAFRRIGISTRYKAKKFKELLEAERLQSLGFKVRKVKDNPTRAITLRLLCQVQGDIKENGNSNGNGKGANTVIIIKVEGVNGDKIPVTQRTVTSIQR